MKYRHILILLVVIIIGISFADTTFVTVGSPFRMNAIPFWGLNFDAFRFQVLYLQSEINHSGRIGAFGLCSTTNQPSSFYNVKVMLCHTSVTQLYTEFNDNYAGNTPVIILEKDSLLVGTGQNLTWYYFPADFDYNNTDNLLLEISWRGDAGSTVNFWRNPNGSLRRCYAPSDTAKSGSVDNVNAYYANIGFVETGIVETPSIIKPTFTIEPSIGCGPFHIKYSGQDLEKIKVEILDICGRLVKRLELVKSGNNHETTWHPENTSEGIYFCRVIANGYATIHGLKLLR
jgi:hypothetical protein